MIRKFKVMTMVIGAKATGPRSNVQESLFGSRP